MASPLDIDNIRKIAIGQVKSDINKITNINVNAIEKATPGSQKPQGTAKLSKNVTTLGKKIIIQLIPTAIDIVRDLIIQIIENEIIKLKEKAQKEQQNVQNQINVLDTRVKNNGNTLEVQANINILTAKKEAISTAVGTVESKLRVQLTKFQSIPAAELPKQIPIILKDLTNFESVSFDGISKTLKDEVRSTATDTVKKFASQIIENEIIKLKNVTQNDLTQANTPIVAQEAISEVTKNVERNLRSQIKKLESLSLKEIPKQIPIILRDEAKKLKEDIKKEQQSVQNEINIVVNKIKNGAEGLESQLERLTLKKNAVPNAIKAVEDKLRSQSLTFNTLSTQIPALVQPILNTIVSDGCPNDPTIKKIIAIRNSLVTSLNIIGKQLDIITKALTGLSTFLDLSQTVIDSLGIAKISISLAVKAIPSPPGVPGVITSTLSDLETIINKLLFEKNGTPRLPKIASSIASATLSVSMVNGYIQQIVGILSALDIKLKQCAPDIANDSSNEIESPGLVPISNSLTSISILQTEAEQTQNGVTYAGFLIEIEEVPYTPTVNRRRAVGKNQSGITLIQTELSFTTQDEILINELKLIIDRDNLKAY
jgi:hypothetical protein